MLPPQTRTATLFPFNEVLRLIKAASAAAPAPSASVFSRSRSRRTAFAISSSSTVTMSSTYFWIRGSVFSPARRTAMPSAMVAAGLSVTAWPSASATFMEGKRAGCTPITRMRGFVSLTAQPTPAINPPPPIGAMMASTSGTCCRISSPIVPWPAITTSSSKGWMKVIPSVSLRRTASSQASS